MRWTALLLLVGLMAGCQGPGRSAAMEHWFPLNHKHPGKGVNTGSKPPCPYFDPPAEGGALIFCEECGTYHVGH